MLQLNMNKTLGSVPLLLNALVNHVGLPPHLPGKQEEEIDEIEDALTVRLLNACRALRDLTEGELSQQWDRIRKILQICKVVNAGGKLDRASLLSEFHTLEQKDLLVLHVTEQNAGLLIRRNHGPQGEIVTFEALEVSALSEKVLAAGNALQWDFPGCAVAIPYSEFANSSFQDNLAAFLEQASTESVKRFAPQAYKAGSSVYESRDTVDPSLITQMLMTLLEVHGYQTFPPPLRKRVRDDVCWTSGAEKPWRRSGYWLLLRVALGRHLSTLHGDEAGRAHYKFLLCLVLARLIDEVLEHLSPELFELLAFLNAKLTRRIVKLEVEKGRASKNVIPLYNVMFSNLGNLFRQTTTKANQRINLVWAEFKSTIQRPIPLIQSPARGRDLILTLANSGPYLKKVLSANHVRGTGPQAFVPYQLPMEFVVAETPFQDFARSYFSLSELESDIEKTCLDESRLKTGEETRCMELAAKFDKYLDTVASAYDSNPEQKSIMILTAVELWVSMDQCATELFCLLLHYNPGIPPGILDVLQLPNITDMYRLHEIQKYLSDRLTKCKFPRMNIFNDPVKDCFAERYFEESKDSHKLQRLHESIETAAELARLRKEKEWQKLSTDFENLETSIAEKSCLYITVNGRGEHSDQQCTKCYLQRKARRMRIQIYEHPLPSKLIQAKAVVFELGCPKSFAAYRNVTWRLIGILAHSEKLDHIEPKLTLGDYSELKAYGDFKIGGVSLASTTKSWLKTHYKGVRFPVSIDQVCVRNGLKLGYYDPISKCWPGRHSQTPSFAHHCRMKIPLNSPFSSLQLASDDAVESIGPSSYAVVASQTKCPSGLNLHEFMAYQSLFSGKSRRWPLILIELGSSNLNFSTEAVTLLIVQLALQAGPAYNLDPLRTVHRVFRDKAFCKRLIEQINQRLGDIYFNWRETNCMEMLLTLILRLCSIASKHIAVEASKLLEKARTATFRWIGLLREEIHRSTDASTFQRCSRYALWAALLCRRTFAMYAVDGWAGEAENLQPPALACFIECSITLQDNSVDDPAELPPLLRNILVRDLKMVYQMRFLLRRSIKASPESLEMAINILWPQAGSGVSRSFCETKFFEPPREWWVQSGTQATLQSHQQSIHFNLLEGHLLIDGKPLGKLPAKHRESLVLVQLFGNKSLLTYPSGLRGMAYTVAHGVKDHEVHIGFRSDCLIVQARYQGTVFELIPHTVFRSPSSFDLPASLIGSGRFEGGNCVHWLNTQTGILDIRQGPEIWKQKPSNWQLDFNTRQARRNAHRYNGGSWLVDPKSSLFQRVARIFHRFELPERLTVFQPQRGSLSVEMRRLELTFHVNRHNLFECRQLRSEVDQNQDAGTWYGLDSKLVLRDTLNSRQRSILVPIGEILYTRNGIHVAVNVISDGNYGRFTINDVLGRLECPTEPRLLYFKAQFHAYTSSVVPDPLTGRTGTEEALHCLKSGYCQPWTPLNPKILQNLMSIANLTPQREYYPKDLKNMQNILWNPHLTTTVQHDAFRPIVKAICEKSERLSYFSAKNTELPSPALKGDSAYLLRRSHQRRLLHQRPDESFNGIQAADMRYDARDRCEASQSRLNAFECVTLIRNWSFEMPKIPNIVDILQSWPTIGGYDRTFDKFLLSDRLDVQFGFEWGSLVNLSRMSGPKDKWRLTFLFAVMSFRNDVEMDILRVLIAFMVSGSLKALDPPEWPSYTQFRQNEIPGSDYLGHLIKNCVVRYAGDERSTLGFSLGIKLRRKLELAQQAHEQQTDRDCKVLVEYLLEQWPCPEPTIEGFSRTLLVDVHQALEIIRPEWLRLFKNMELSNYIQVVQNILDLNTTRKSIDPPKLAMEAQEALTAGFHRSTLPDLPQHLIRKSCPILSKKIPQQTIWNEQKKKFPSSTLENGLDGISKKENIPNNMLTPSRSKCVVSSVSREIQELESIINEISNSQSTVHQRYGRDMMQSLDALKIIKSVPKSDLESIHLARLRSEISSAQRTVRERFDQISLAFERNDLRAPWLKAGGLWPCITPVTLLEQLRSSSPSKFGAGMKQSLVEYAISITALQHLLRLEDAYLKGNKQRLLEEQNNYGHGNWQPLENPDWLLVEIDANILIRPDQVDVALATISPASGSNSVLQMNMGQGKTSCIMPMVAAVLADTKKLVRVVVPNPLLLQTAQVLQARLGGLLGREITHVPFSRKTSTNPETIRTYFNIHQEVRASSGVMVALPEHILSFMLSGLQRLLDSRLSEATQMIKIQKKWMQEVCRDILDECDFTLAVRTQLIYPSGSQTTVDGHPHRWETAEALLRLVEDHLWNLQRDFPTSIEVVRRPQGGFPMIFFLRKDVEDALIAWLVKNISRGQTSIIPTKECSQSDRLAIKQFISEVNVRPAVTERIRQLFPDKPSAQQNLYLLRGLLVHRILLLTLKKRWNVQYGLHPTRDPIAVPFHAKGVPSDQSEWGHPDCAILFTCLAFYYDGLNQAQLRQSLEHIVKSDDPSSEYDRWTQSSNTLPDSLHEWNVINVDDEAQLMELWQNFRYKVVVIDYYLNRFVFPKHAKQFRMKLQASGWDIPLFLAGSESTERNRGAEKSLRPLTTGFSGTNDNRTMLPLTIKQEDLRGLSHTNTEVLTYLLEPRSRKYQLAKDPHGKHFSETNLLFLLRQQGIRMLIDAGAQILEMDNLSLVKAWLKEDHSAPAAVFFNAENKLTVLYRQGSQVPLSATPFAENLGECLVYLDDAHTRGTDLKMPANAKGALTLGLGQTKDQTVQAAMRLRQLGTSQSIVFFAPPEVHQSIIDLRQNRQKFYEPIDSYDVICWLVEQTCVGIEQIQPLYISQGTDFCRRNQAASDHPNFLDDPNQRDAYLNALRQTEHQTLEQLYKPRIKPKPAKISNAFCPEIGGFMKELNNRRKDFRDLGNAVHGSALQEVEQEREVAFEVEAVREVQKPIHLSPLLFPGLHKDIRRFVETGRLAAGRGGYEHAFAALRRTALGLKYGFRSEAITSNLFISKEFARTVSMPLGRVDDNFIRPVNWILWSSLTETALVIIPEEVELVIPLVREVKETLTHLLTYAAPVTRKMLHFNNLGYYAIPAMPTGWEPPAWLTIELGIIAGRLYFGFEEYGDLRKYLGFREQVANPREKLEDTVHSNELQRADRGADDTADEDDTQVSTREGLSFTSKPLAFLQDWLAVRRKGQDFKHTPMGYICQDKHLTADHPFYTRVENDGGPKIDWREGKAGVDTNEDVDSDMEFDEDDAFFDVAADEAGGLDEFDELDAKNVGESGGKNSPTQGSEEGNEGNHEEGSGESSGSESIYLSGDE